MKETNEAYLKLKRTVNGLWRSIAMRNCIWINSESEAKYLMSGHATELIDSVYIPCIYDEEATARIYGVVAADQSKRRYIWIYLFYRNHIWRCYSNADAYVIVEKIKRHNKLQKKEQRMKEKLRHLNPTLKVCVN